MYYIESNERFQRMPILLDYNHVALSCVFQDVGFGQKDIDEDFVRHVILNAIRSHYVKNKAKYGQMIVCCDGSNSWRKEYFPLYKAGRTKSKEDNKAMWDNVFKVIGEIREAMTTEFPWKVIHIQGVEADDIIAHLTKKYAGNDMDDDIPGGIEPVLILSSDKDFKQLHKYKGVAQYSPTQKKFITCEDPYLYLSEHIMVGDGSDGIPNMLSDDDCIATVGKKQTPATKSIKEVWLSYYKDQEKFFDDLRDGKILPKLKGKISVDVLLKNYHRNKMMIDFDAIPKDIHNKIEEAYNQENSGSLQQVMRYFQLYRMKNMLNVLNDFKGIKHV